jgi:hypothetical protein
MVLRLILCGLLAKFEVEKEKREFLEALGFSDSMLVFHLL